MQMLTPSIPAHLADNPAFWRGMAATRSELLTEAQRNGDRLGAENHARILRDYEARAERAAVTFRRAA